MKLKPCKYLDYESEYEGWELRVSEEFPEVKYWYRKTLPYEEASRTAQFCKKKGRIRGIFQCYIPGELECYEPKN